MEKENKDKKGNFYEDGYVIVTNHFLGPWLKELGPGPAMLYVKLLSYCHQGKDTAWPSLRSLSQEMGLAKTTLIRHQHTLIKFGLIKKISKGRAVNHPYKNNLYQIIFPPDLPDHPERKIGSARSQNATANGSKMKPLRLQNDTSVGSKMKPSMVAKCYPNNNNKHYQYNNQDVVAVDFKKLREEGEEKMNAIREQLLNLDFKESFIEKLLQDYPPEKIEEKLELLMEGKNIQNPAGWLRSALKNDYQNPEQERPDEEPVEQASNLSRKSQKTFSRKVALRGIRLIRESLSLPVSSRSPSGREPG